MSKWIDGSIPTEKDTYYWLTIKNGGVKYSYPAPCKYSDEYECWLDANGKLVPTICVVAYYPIKQPKSYQTIGTGSGFYIRTFHNNNEFIYGRDLQYISWANRGYDSQKDARVAAKRLKKLDETNGYAREKYEVIDGQGNSVWTMTI